MSVYHIKIKGENVLFEIDTIGGAVNRIVNGKMIYPYHGIDFTYKLHSDFKTHKIDKGGHKYFIRKFYAKLEEVNYFLNAVKRSIDKAREKVIVEEEERYMSEVALYLIKTDARLNDDQKLIGGDIARRSIVSSLENVLNGRADRPFKLNESDYEEIFDHTLREHLYIHKFGVGKDWSFYPSIYEQFFSNLGRQYGKFKMVDVPGKIRVPRQRLCKCETDEFLRASHRELPLFLGTQFGIYPRQTPEILECLEGQKIVMLNKSLVSGFEHSLSLCEVKNGRVIKIREFLREGIVTLTRQA